MYALQGELLKLHLLAQFACSHLGKNTIEPKRETLTHLHWHERDERPYLRRYARVVYRLHASHRSSRAFASPVHSGKLVLACRVMYDLSAAYPGMPLSVPSMS